MPGYQSYTGMALRTMELLVPWGSQAETPAPRLRINNLRRQVGCFSLPGLLTRAANLTEWFAPLGFFAQAGLQNFSAGVAG